MDGRGASVRTFGVEEEFLLVDPQSGCAVPASPQVLAGVDDVPAWSDEPRGDPRPGAAPACPRRSELTMELQQQMIEVATPPRTALATLSDDLHRLRRTADAAARRVGARVAALATSPLPARPRLSPSPRYQAIGRALALTCDEQLTCGCHVHVAVASPDEGVAVLDRIRPWLPAVAAVATNSPYWNGIDTGYASYRTQSWSRWPATGPTEVFGSAAAYRRLVEDMIGTGTLLDEGMVYFDARLSRRYPTVEVRVADVCLDVADAVLVAALCRALVDTAAGEWRAGAPASGEPAALLRLASWRSSRSGTDGDLVDPRTHRLRPAADVLAGLVGHVEAALRANGDLDVVRESIRRVVEQGTGARAQRESVARHGRLDAMVLEAVERTCA